jgi:hypothetical protein
MIHNKAEFEGAQRELRYLKGFLSRAESAPDHPNRELSIISIYKKMYFLWEELEEYYSALLPASEAREPSEEPAVIVQTVGH